MITIRLYLDEDSMNHSLVVALRGQGVDVLTAFEAGLVSAADDDQLLFATQQGRAIYSYNARDFYRLHAEHVSSGKSHAGVILCHQQQFSIGEQARRTAKLMSVISAPEMIDRVEFLSAWG